ncbi:MAG TPA: sigma factor [Cytophagales bacterium]|jgi:DNA-directed RNA polymerase specialized sigma24 family protein
MNAYAEIRQHIAAYAQRLTPDRGLADEITQQVLINVHQSLAQLNEPHKLQAWLRRLTWPASAPRPCWLVLAST